MENRIIPELKYTSLALIARCVFLCVCVSVRDVAACLTRPSVCACGTKRDYFAAPQQVVRRHTVHMALLSCFGYFKLSQSLTCVPLGLRPNKPKMHLSSSTTRPREALGLLPSCSFYGLCNSAEIRRLSPLLIVQSQMVPLVRRPTAGAAAPNSVLGKQNAVIL